MFVNLVDLLFVAFIFLPLCTCIEIVDVTTIYDVGQQSQSGYTSVPVRIQKRTNALGLAVFSNTGSYLDTIDTNSTLSCDSTKSCYWENFGWMQGEMYETGKAYHISTDLKLLFSKSKPTSTSSRQDKVQMVFTTGRSSMGLKTNTYVLEIFPDQLAKVHSNCREAVLKYNYSSSYVHIKDRNGEDLAVTCDSHQEFPLNIKSTYVISQKEMKVLEPTTQRPRYGRDYGLRRDPIGYYPHYTYKHVLKIYTNNTDGDEIIIPSWENLEVNYVYFNWDDDSSIKPWFPSKDSGLKQGLLKSIGVGNTLTSPVFTPSSSQICLALVVYSAEDITEDVLQISVEDVFERKHVVSTLNNLKASWQVKHIHADISNISTPIKLTIETLNAVEIEISQISTCSLSGSEVDVPPRHMIRDRFTNDLKNTLPIYSAPSENYPRAEKEHSNSCMNGGVNTTSGCACPPGFKGSQCQTGCGRNRFGQDCGGKCSLHTRECEGLILCTSFTGCGCAPGYTGPTCKTQCTSGTSGNDCAQQCGQCAEGTCDRYTGMCTACVLGYRAPYCKQEYIYLSNEPVLTSEQYGTITVSFNLEEVEGYGQPKLYQIQYREKDEDDEWTTFITKDTENAKTNLTKETIEGLTYGVVYEVRVLLMNIDFNKYEGTLVKSSELRTKCYISDDFDYKVQGTSNRSAISFSWTYNPTDQHCCPVERFEVSWKEDWQWLTNYTTKNRFILTDLLPGSLIDFKVKAKTSGGDAPFSQMISLTTENFGSNSVVDLQVTSIKSNCLEVSWNHPPGNENREMNYTITCKCVRQVACPSGCESFSKLQVIQENSTVVLCDLLPFTQFVVSVTPEGGPESRIYAGTSGSVPIEVPEASYIPPLRTNTSIMVFWEPVPICTSFLQGYNFQLTKAQDDTTVLADGFTKKTSASFYNLTASTNYIVKVFIKNLVGWNPKAFLSINVTTSATVPEAVRSLTVYKKGRSMLGLRWAEPATLYGKLRSFTVQHSMEAKEVSSVTVEPTPCIVWPELYCHTIENLKPNREYTVMVSARNFEIDEDGAVSSICEITKESGPTAPQNLTVHNRTSTTVSLQWRFPDLVNGILRSFVVTIEESEKFDQDTCCQDFPLIEILVKDESEFYSAEISGLNPAATYYVSVSAKTVTMGPSQSLMVSTTPPHLPISVLPPLELMYDLYLPGVERNISWLSQENLGELNNSEIQSTLISTQFVLLVSNETRSSPNITSGIKDSQLLFLLQDSIPSQFYFLAEYNKDGLVPESDWGSTPSPNVLQNGSQYQLLAVQVTNYTGVYNIDLLYSSQFVYH